MLTRRKELVKFAILIDHRVKIKESKKPNRELKNSGT